MEEKQRQIAHIDIQLHSIGYTGLLGRCNGPALDAMMGGIIPAFLRHGSVACGTV